MKRLIYGLIISICLFPNIVSGLECTNDDRLRLQKLADNVTYVLEEYEDNGNTYFKVTFSGVSQNTTLFSYQNYRDYTYIDYNDENFIGEVSEKYIIPGSIITFDVNGLSSECGIIKLRRITINVPYYNEYYNDPICDGVKLSICQKWTNNNDVSYGEFINRVTEYKNNKSEIVEDNKNNNNNQNNNYFDFMDIYNKYYLPTFICMICLLVILIILWIRENKKNKL